LAVEASSCLSHQNVVILSLQPEDRTVDTMSRDAAFDAFRSTG